MYNTTAHGVGMLERWGQGTGGKASTEASLKQTHPQQRGAAPGARAGTGGRMAPYSTRPQRQRQEKGQFAAMGYQPVRGGKRNKGRGAAAMGMVPSSVPVPMYPAMGPYSSQQAMYGAKSTAGGGQGTSKGKMSTALATAQAIINSAALHPKKAEIKQVSTVACTAHAH